MIKLHTAILLFLSMPFSVLAQPIQKEQELKTVSVNSVFIKKTTLREGSRIELDSTVLKQYQNRTLGDVLQENSQAFIKNYGIGSLSTLSIRGSSAAQTAVLWHGVNVNSANTGLSDFSLFPAAIFSQIQLSASNEGTIGGAVILSNGEPVYRSDAHLKLGLGYESIGTKSLLFSQMSSSKRWHLQNNFFVNHSNNHFSYLNPYIKQETTLTHARSQQFGLLSDGYRKLNTKHELSYHLWLHRYVRQIPPTIYETLSSKSEWGGSFRAILAWQRNDAQQKKHWHAHVGYVRESYEYDDSLLQLTSQTKTQFIPAQLLFRQQIKQGYIEFQWNNAVANLINQADSSILKSGPKITAQRLILRSFSVKGFVQKEWSDRFDIPLTYGFSLNKHHHPFGLQMFATYHRAVRTPTLNELFYNPGGNPRLKPERSDNVEVGASIEKQRPTLGVKSEFTYFYRYVQNWILWYGNAIFTPHNIATVVSRGINYQLNASYLLKHKPTAIHEGDQTKDVMLKTSLYYAYTLSTSEDQGGNLERTKGKQIAYVPRYLAKGNIGIVLPRWELQYSYQYTGYRFTTLDESEFLLPYAIHSLKGGLHTDTYQYRIRWQLALNNILNQYYEGVWGRVMPGRNIGVSVIFEPIRKNCCKKM